MTLVCLGERRKHSDVILEQQGPQREEVGIDGWVKKTSGCNMGDCCLFPVNVGFFYS